MEWWMIGIAVVIVLIVAYLIYQNSSEEEEDTIEKFSEMIDEGKIEKVKKKAKDSMEIYEAYQHSANKTPS